MSLQILFSKQLDIDYTNDSQFDCKVLTIQRFQKNFLFDNAKIKEYIYLNPTHTRTFYLENSRSKAYNRSISYIQFSAKTLLSSTAGIFIIISKNSNNMHTQHVYLQLICNLRTPSYLEGCKRSNPHIKGTIWQPHVCPFARHCHHITNPIFLSVKTLRQASKGRR